MNELHVSERPAVNVYQNQMEIEGLWIKNKGLDSETWRDVTLFIECFAKELEAVTSPKIDETIGLLGVVDQYGDEVSVKGISNMDEFEEEVKQAVRRWKTDEALEGAGWIRRG